MEVPIVTVGSDVGLGQEAQGRGWMEGTIALLLWALEEEKRNDSALWKLLNDSENNATFTSIVVWASGVMGPFNAFFPPR